MDTMPPLPPALSVAGSVWSSHAAQDGDTIDNSTVSVFDVRRFMGKWYEIARYDHRTRSSHLHKVPEPRCMAEKLIRLGAHRCFVVDDVATASKAVIVIRSSANTPMDQNSPEDIHLDIIRFEVQVFLLP